MNTQTHRKIIQRKGEFKRCSVCGQEGHSKLHHEPLPLERCCRVCGIVKPIKDFGKQKSVRTNGFVYENYTRICRPCDLARSAKRYRSSYDKRFGYILASIKSRCDKDGITFSLQLEDLLAKLEQQEGLCFYSRLPLSLDTGNHAVSVDRIDPFGPYSNENTVLVCWLVNHMKRQQTHDEFISLCKRIAENH